MTNTNKTDDLFLSFIQSWTHFLNQNSYTVTPACVLSFYQIIDQIELLNLRQFCGISKSLFAKNQMQFESHDDFFNRFIKNHMKTAVNDMVNQEKDYVDKRIKQLREDYENDKIEHQKEAEKQFDELIKKMTEGQTSTIKKQKKLLEEMSQRDISELEKLCSDNTETKGLLTLNPETIRDNLIEATPATQTALKQALNALMLEHLSKPDPNPTLTELLIQSADTLKKIQTAIEREKKKAIKNAEQRQKELNDQLADLKQKLAEKNQIIKNETKNHRTGEFEGKNSVLDLSRINDRAINDLTQTEYETLLSYIQLNAAKFRTKLSRSMRQSSSKVFDYRTTMQQSVKYFGTPMKLYYKRPVIKKYKLVCFMDVSGSVAKHLKLLVSFLYEINTVFSGGVKTYGFVSDLIDFTEIFRNETIDQAVKELAGWRGYSDYNKALCDFNEQYLSQLDRNTIVLFFGDARNNKNPSGLNYLQAIKDKSRALIWLNPEEYAKWYTGDSILSTYEPLMTQHFPTRTTKDLIQFMENFSLDNPAPKHNTERETPNVKQQNNRRHR